jgi:regulator of sigma E protease
VAYAAAGSGFADLIHFLGFLSINLAVLNFLPIPPLDGGQMLFLIAEKVRGRPLPDSALIAGTYLGLIFVLCLMVFVTYQDVFRLFTG